MLQSFVTISLAHWHNPSLPIVRAQCTYITEHSTPSLFTCSVFTDGGYSGVICSLAYSVCTFNVCHNWSSMLGLCNVAFLQFSTTPQTRNSVRRQQCTAWSNTRECIARTKRGPKSAHKRGEELLCSEASGQRTDSAPTVFCSWRYFFFFLFYDCACLH